MSLATFSKIVRYKIIHPRHGTDECNICSKYKAKMKAAGLDKVLAAVQNQVDAFLAGN
jgi:hypothetical protein